MRLKRLLALSLAGVMIVSSVGAGDMKAFAAESSAFTQEETSWGYEEALEEAGVAAEEAGAGVSDEDTVAFEDDALTEDIVVDEAEAGEDAAEAEEIADAEDAADAMVSEDSAEAGNEGTDDAAEEVLSEAVESAVEADAEFAGDAEDAAMAEGDEEALGAASGFTKDDFAFHDAYDTINVNDGEMFGVGFAGDGSRFEEYIALKKEATFKWTVSDPSVLVFVRTTYDEETGITTDTYETNSFSGKGTDYDFCMVRGKKPGKATVTVKFADITMTYDINVEEKLVVDKEYFTLTKNENAFEKLTVKGKTDEATKFSINVERYISEEENPDLEEYQRWVEDNSFVKVIEEGDQSTYKDGMRTRYYTLEPGDKTGLGRIMFFYEEEVYVNGVLLHHQISAGCDFDILEPEQLNIGYFYGCNIYPAEDDEHWDGRSFLGYVTNGDQICLDNYERGAEIYYMAQYSDSEIPAEPTAAQIIEGGKTYENPYIVVSKTGKGYLRFSAVAHKKNAVDSKVLTALLTFGYGEEEYYDPDYNWLDVIPDDRGLYDNDMSKVVGSGLVVSNEVEFWYDDEAGKYVCDGTVRNPGGAYFYTGEKLTFDEDIRVYYDGRRLYQGIDYVVTYYNNVKVCDGDLNNSKAPYFTVKLLGDKKTVVKKPFSIIKRFIKDVDIDSDPQVTVFQGDKFTEKGVGPVVDLSTRYTFRTLKLGTDYKLTYYRESGDGFDFSKELTFNEIKNVPGDYVFNVVGLGGFEGKLIENKNDPKKTILKILPKAEKRERLSLEKVKVNKKKISFDYEEDGEGKAVVQSKKVIKGLEDGTYVLKIGKTEIKYMTEEKFKTLSDEEKKFGYYYSVFDPASEPEDDWSNRYPDSGSISIQPFNYDDPDPAKSYHSKLFGIYRLEFAIKGITISVSNVKTEFDFDNFKSIAVYDEDGYLDKMATLAKLAKSPTEPVKVINKATGKELSTDCFEVWVNDDGGDAGTKTVEFYGVFDRGVINNVSKKIKVKPVKITAAKVTAKDDPESIKGKNILVQIADGYDDGEGNIVVPYSKAGATPLLDVFTLGKDGERWWLAEGLDYTVSYSNNKKAGAKASVTLKFKRNFSGTVKNAISFKVGPRDFTLQEENIEATAADVKLVAGKKNNFKSTLVLYDNGKKLTAGKDYTIVPGTLQYTYGEDITRYWQSGELATYISKGTPIPEGTSVPAGTCVEVSFMAVPKNTDAYALRGEDEQSGAWFGAKYFVGNDISACKVTVKDQYYNMNGGVIPRKADITIYDKKVDWTLAPEYYEIIDITNNYSVGTATMTIRGTGTWCGTKKVKFKIVNKVDNVDKKS